MADRIDQWYQDADTLLHELRNLASIGGRRICLSSNFAIDVMPDEDPADIDLLHQRQVESERTKRDHAYKTLVASRDRTLNKVGELRDRFVQHLNAPDKIITSIYPVLRDFNVEGLPSGRFAWPALEGLGYLMATWCPNVAHRLHYSNFELGSTENLELEKIQDETPFSETRFEALRERLFLERTQIQRDQQDRRHFGPVDPIGKNVPESDLNEPEYAKLPNRLRHAILAFEQAEQFLCSNGAKKVTADSAWEWVSQHYEEYDFNTATTFAQYLSQARNKLNKRKNHPVAGRSGRSVVNQSEL